MFHFCWLALGCLLFVRSTHGCTCIPFHPQTAVCEGDFAIIGRPVFVVHIPHTNGPDLPNDPKELFEFQNYLYRLYVVKVIKVFKGNSLTDGQFMLLRVPGSSAACGIQIMGYNENPKFWLLVGGKEGNVYRTNACNWNRLWSSLTFVQRHNLYFNRYLNNCGCKIVQCPGNDCGKRPACRWYNPKFNDCYIKQLRCRKMRRGNRRLRCRWAGPGQPSCTSGHLPLSIGSG